MDAGTPTTQLNDSGNSQKFSDSEGKTLRRLTDAAEQDRENWLKQGDEINRYTTGDDYDFLYQEFAGELSLKARVNKAAEFQQTLGPYIYPQNPDAAVNSEPWATVWAKRRHEVEERYADYAARVGSLATHMKRAVSHALIYGRAPIITGFNQRRGIIQSVSDVAANYLNDPDAKTEEEINWQSRIRVKPRWEVAQRYPDSKAIVDRLPVYSVDPKVGKDRTRDQGSELVRYQEVWMGVGLRNYMPSLEAVQADRLGDVNAKMKYCIADGHILRGGDWEIPFFHIDEWPVTPLDLLERSGCLYPYQPMEPGIGHLRVLNKIYTTFIVKYILMSRTPFARMTINGQAIPLDQLHKLLHGDDLSILNVVVNGNEQTDINTLFQRIDWGDPVPGFERIWGLVVSEFERSTGLTEVLSTGQTPSQIRSATAAQLIETRSKNRVDAMREAVLKTLERIYRKTLFGARYLHGSEDIARLFGPAAGQVWGELGSPEDVSRESQMRAQVAQMAAQSGVPADGIEEAIGPPQLIDMSAWIAEADRTVDAGSMRRLDVDAQVQNINVAMNQLGPAVANLPGGGELIAALAGEFARINRLSPRLIKAADGMATAIQQANAMQAQAAAMQAQGPPPQAPPNSGPMGGTPQINNGGP